MKPWLWRQQHQQLISPLCWSPSRWQAVSGWRVWLCPHTWEWRSVWSVWSFMWTDQFPKFLPRRNQSFLWPNALLTSFLMVTDQLYPRLKVSSITGEINFAAVRMLCSASYLQLPGEELSTRSTPSSSASSSSSSSSTLDAVLCLIPAVGGWWIAQKCRF